jgi:hypothetical protein
MVVGSLQTKRAEDTLEGLAVAAMILCHLSAGARQFWPLMIGHIGVEPLFQRSSGETKNLPAGRSLHCFKVQVLGGSTA